MMAHATRLLMGAGLVLAFVGVAGADPLADDIDAIIRAAGGRDKLLTLFRIKERLNVSSDPAKPGNERVSVIEPPEHWWLGKNRRVNEPASYLVWAWTLGILTDDDSEIAAIPDVVDDAGQLMGLRVSGSVTPPMDLYFDKTSHRLTRIDWRSDIHRCSDWRTHDGVTYPAKVVGYKKSSGKPWYFTEVLEVERLNELPAGLSRE